MTAQNNRTLEQQAREFFDYVGSAKAHAESGGEIEFGIAWSEQLGWRVVMKVGSRVMNYPPGWGRKFARESRAGAERRIAAMDPIMRARLNPEAMLAVFDEMDNACKEAMRMTRQTTPANTP